MVLVSNGQDLLISSAKGERRGTDERESTFPLKMMKQKDELDPKDHCRILFLGNLLNLGG